MKQGQRFSRRVFLRSGTALTAVALGVSRSAAAGDSRVAFVTANLVAQVSGWRFELAHWGDQHKKTVAATDEGAWRAICAEIAGCGFQAVEVWEAHAAPEVMDREKAAAWKAVLDEQGLKPIGYGGQFSRKTVEICQWLGIPQINGWMDDETRPEASSLCRDTGVRFNIENHPEKSAKEVVDKIGGGNDWLGVCVDTGWFGTQGVSAPAMIRELGPLVRHTHIKDVKAAGGHETCLLGEGVAEVAECIGALKEIGYGGWYSWEDEPEARNPFDSAERNRRWIEERVGREV